MKINRFIFIWSLYDSNEESIRELILLNYWSSIALSEHRSFPSISDLCELTMYIRIYSSKCSSEWLLPDLLIFLLRHLKLGASIHIVPAFLREVIEVLLSVVDVSLRVLPTYPKSIVAGVGKSLEYVIVEQRSQHTLFIFVFLLPFQEVTQALVEF